MGNKGEGRPSPFIRGITNRPLVAAVRRIRSIEILHWTRFPFEKSMPGQEPALNSRAATNGRRALLRGWVVVRTISGLFLFLLVAVPALSQTFRGGINGVITDQSGGVVPVAEIRATNEATGLSYTTASSNAGEFSFQDLPLGSYTIVITAAGFQTAKVDGVRVSAGAIYTLPVKLNLAQVASTIEVNAAALSLDTTEIGRAS